MASKNISRRAVIVAAISVSATPRVAGLSIAAARPRQEEKTNDLLELAIAAHGGWDRWRKLTKLTAWATIGGALWALKGKEGKRGSIRIEIDPHREHLEQYPFLGIRGQHSVFEPDRVAVEADDGRILQSRNNPRAAFAGHVLATPWDDLHLVYFSGSAEWTYLTTPFFVKLPGFKTEEIEPWSEAGQEWRRLKVLFPPSIASHSTDQVFYFNKNGILCRHDYIAEVAGGRPAANYASNPKEFGGFVMPTARRVYSRGPDNHPVTDRTIVAIDFHDIRAE
jgi:hypothetical protein